MDDAQIARQRLVSHGLAGSPFRTIDECVGWLGAVQAQEYAVAKYSIGQRATGLRDADVDHALAEGTLVRTHLLRPTWHFVAARDVRWMLELTAPRVHAANAHYYRRLGLDGPAFARAAAVLGDTLAGGRQLTRQEIAAAFAGAGCPADGTALGFLLMHAELEAVICSGGLSGKQRTYALFDERVPPAAPVDRDWALAELSARYFTSRGPATLDDFTWWSGLTRADARRGIELARGRLERLTVGERTFWRGAGEPPDRGHCPPAVHLVQGYDEYLVAYRSTRAAADVAGARAATAGRGPFLHAILAAGHVIGTWRRQLTARAMTIDVQLWRPVDDAERDALSVAIERYAEFVGLPATWSADAGAPAPQR